VVTIPPEFSPAAARRREPRIALIEDNTDQFSAVSLEGALTQLLASYNQKTPAPRLTANVLAVGGRGLSLRAVHPVPAARHDRAGDLRLAR